MPSMSSTWSRRAATTSGSLRAKASRIRYAKDMNLEALFQSIVNQVGAKTIFGDPISANGKTIVPVAKVRYGFGAGTGRKSPDNEEGFGGGGGFTAKDYKLQDLTLWILFDPLDPFDPLDSFAGVSLRFGAWNLEFVFPACSPAPGSITEDGPG